MGYVVQSSTVDIVYGPDEQYPGLEVVCRGQTSADALLYFRRFADFNPDRAEALEQLRDGIKRFGDELLVSWNIELKEGEPLPATGDGMAKIPDTMLCIDIMTRWTKAVARPAGPLSAASSPADALAAVSTPLGATR